MEAEADKKRPTRSKVTVSVAHCDHCGWKSESKNSLGRAARHYDHTGHTVVVQQEIHVVYGTGSAVPKDPDQLEMF